MSKQAILQITPAKKDDGSDYNLFLSLYEEPSDTPQWTWAFPNHMGRGVNDIGIFTKSLTTTTTIYCLQTDGQTESNQIKGIVSRTLNEFPFTPDDYTNKLSGTLHLDADNYYLVAGDYTWTVYNVII